MSLKCVLEKVLSKIVIRTFFSFIHILLLGDIMDYKVIINPELGGNEVGNTYNGQTTKDYNLKFSQLLSNKLTNIGVSNLLVRNIDKAMSNEERINYIKNNSSAKSIVISNGLGSESGIEIIYSLKNNDTLASRLANNLEENNFKVNKYYQKRASSDTSKDYEPLIRDLDNQSIIIRYGNLNTDNRYLNERIDDLVDVVANTLKSYLGLSNDYYIVKKGDNLYAIARMFNTTVDSIKKLNNLSSNNLSIGQRLTIKSIPSTLPDTNNYYIVKKGDNLYSIARKYNLTVAELKKNNNLSSNLLSIGQKLIIDKPKNIKTYTVVNGDRIFMGDNE